MEAKLIKGGEVISKAAQQEQVKTCVFFIIFVLMLSAFAAVEFFGTCTPDDSL